MMCEYTHSFILDWESYVRLTVHLSVIFYNIQNSYQIISLFCGSMDNIKPPDGTKPNKWNTYGWQRIDLHYLVILIMV